MVETTWMEVELDNIKSNYKNIRKSVKENTYICGVVKADAYGHGAVEVAKVLEKEGVNCLAVARLEEAIELRNNGIVVPILCLGYIPKENYKYAIEKNIRITIYSYESAVELNKIAKEINKKALVHIKIDTGMGRIGFLPNEESVKIIKEIYEFKNIHVEGIYTHFAKADEENKEYTYEQINKFNYIYDELEKVDVNISIRHVSNSAGIIDLSELDYEMVRCGIILYGYNPSDEVNTSKIELKPAMKLKTKVAHVKKVKKGEAISYGGKFLAEKDTHIVTLPIGYADGYFRGQKNPKVSIKGKLYPVVGRICMDQCMVNIEDNKYEIKQGDEVVVYGNENGVNEVSKDINSINYEVLCAISRRVDRVYMESSRKKKSYIL